MYMFDKKNFEKKKSKKNFEKKKCRKTRAKKEGKFGWVLQYV